MNILIDKYIMSLYTDLEDEVIADIARRVKKTGRYTETAELMAKSMREQGYSTAKIQSEVMKRLRADKNYKMTVAENTKAYKQMVTNLIKDTVHKAKKAGDKLVAEAGLMAWNNDLSMWQAHGVNLQKPNTMSQLITAFRKQTNDELRNLTKTTGFKDTVFGTTGILNMYQREMDLALLKVATGTFSYDQAVNDCVHRLAQSGLRSIDYANGKAYQLDTAVRMSVRTGMSQLSGKITEENLKSTGQDLVITSQHMGSRPEHADWQNKVFSFSGKSKKYPDFRKATGYGTVTGLKGAHCTHDFYPFWEGASVIPDDIKEPEPVIIDGKEYTRYQATQKQRKMERDIRATKREIEAQKAINGDVDVLQSRLRKQTSDYKQFSEKAGLKVKNNRLRVVGGSSNLPNKAKQNALKEKPKTSKGNNTKPQISRKAVTAKELDDMSVSELRAFAEKTAIDYYNSGVSGISFGEVSIEDAAKRLAQQGSRTSLNKDILSMQKKLRNHVENTEKSSKIKVTKVVSGHSGTPKESSPNDIIDHIGKNNKIDTRGFYDASGMKEKDIHTTNHGYPLTHDYGKNGEHAHDYEWDDAKSLKNKTTRELSESERKENSDIL